MPESHEPAPSSIAHWIEHLQAHSLAHFNQLVVWCLLGTAAILAVWPRFEIREGIRQGPAPLLFWLPDAVLDSPVIFWLLRVTLIIGIALWITNRWLPWSCWLTVIGFTGLWSMHVENTYNTAHIFHMANM